MQNKKLTLQRLQKQQRQLALNPIPGVLVKRQDVLNFHFVFYELDGCYKGGYYHGKLELHQNYPFSPPKLIFFTPTGRFSTNLPICTTFTNYHSEEWSTAWNIRTLLIATISFMVGGEQGYGCINTSEEAKIQLATESLKHNLQNGLFRQLFATDLKKLSIHIEEEFVEPNLQNNNQLVYIDQNDKGSNKGNNHNNKKNWVPIVIYGGILGAAIIGIFIYGTK